MVKKCSKERKQKVFNPPMWFRKVSKPERPLASRARWCQTCGQVRKAGPRHQFDQPTHVMRALTSEERRQSQEAENTGDAGEYVLTLESSRREHLPAQKHHPVNSVFLEWRKSSL